MENNRLFVGNLAFQTTEDDLRTAFEAHGTVVSVKLMTERDTGRSRGFAFVEMESGEDARRAISALNDTDLDGRRIQVSVAKPREERSGGGGGGAGGDRSASRSRPRW